MKTFLWYILLVVTNYICWVGLHMTILWKKSPKFEHVQIWRYYDLNWTTYSIYNNKVMFHRLNTTKIFWWFWPNFSSFLFSITTPPTNALWMLCYRPLNLNVLNCGITHIECFIFTYLPVLRNLYFCRSNNSKVAGVSAGVRVRKRDLGVARANQAVEVEDLSWAPPGCPILITIRRIHITLKLKLK